MRAYQQERLENAICFFADGHHRGTHRALTQTELYKYLAFFDFRMLEATGRAPLDLDYLAMEHGPVPVELYSARRELTSSRFRFEELADGTILVHPNGAPEMDYFSEDEVQEMEQLLEIFATSGMKARTMSTASHQSIRAWSEARARRPNGRIDKADTFPGIREKAPEELSAAEERYLSAEALRKPVA